MKYEPLVSVRVLTYNSSKYVLETLESIKAQTYNKIELVISDDCSKDNTVELCRNWLEENKDRFVRTELLTVLKNTGITANGNRSFRVCQGEWIKGIAGDDAMMPDCIESYIGFINEHPEAKFITAKTKNYKLTFDEKNVLPSNQYSLKFLSDINQLTPKQQLYLYIYILSDTVSLCAPTFFCNHKLLKDIGYYDESFMIEDMPLIVRILEKGYKYYFMDKYTIKYRLNDSTSNNFGSGRIVNPFLRKALIEVYTRLFWKYLTYLGKFRYRLMNAVMKLYENPHLNKSGNRIYYYSYTIIMRLIVKKSKWDLKNYNDVMKKRISDIK